MDIMFRHFGMFVRDLGPMRRFYENCLGLFVTDEGELEVDGIEGTSRQRLLFLSNDPEEHHQIVLVEGAWNVSGFNRINQISFHCTSLAELRRAHGRILGVADDIRPVVHGNSWSVYFRDPEGNRLELYTETPWYVQQPCREPLDFARSDDEILAETEALCRTRKGFTARSEWVSRMKREMDQARRPGPQKIR
jgi:catechol 2,3-dioxygenase